MGFLQQYDSVPPGNVPGQIGLLIDWLRNRPLDLFEELRADRPVFDTPVFLMLTRASEVYTALSQPEIYTVQDYARTMKPSVGDFMLASDTGDLHWREKSLMRSVLRLDDLPFIRQQAGRVAQDAIKVANGRLDIVPTIARGVPVAIVRHHFGFDAPDETLREWSFKTQHAMFRNLAGSAKADEANVAAGNAMRDWLRPFLDEKRWNIGLLGDDAVSRLVRLSMQPDIQLDPERVVSNVCGLLVGAIETINQAISQIVDQFLAHRDLLAAARTAAMDEDPAVFDGHVFEALRFNPITWLQVRHAGRDVTIAAPGEAPVEVKAGKRIAVCTGSAMFDAALMPNPTAFDPHRPSGDYMHFGVGLHQCLGRNVASVAVPEAVRQLLRLNNLRRAPGKEGELSFGADPHGAPTPGPFPEHLTVEWN